jgi:hypothetical protein
MDEDNKDNNIDLAADNTAYDNAASDAADNTTADDNTTAADNTTADAAAADTDDAAAANIDDAAAANIDDAATADTDDAAAADTDDAAAANIDDAATADTDDAAAANIDDAAAADTDDAAAANIDDAAAANIDAADTTEAATADTDITSAITDTDNNATGDTATTDTTPDNGDSTSDAGESTADADTPSKPSASEWIMQHKWIIAIIVIVSMIIICIALYFGYKYYIKYQENQAQKQNKNQNLNLNLCKYGLNSAKTNCKYKQCLSKKQINSKYGECKNLTTYCKAPNFISGISNAAETNCVRDCNYTGTSSGKYDPVWKASYNTKYPGITAYMYVWTNTATYGLCHNDGCGSAANIAKIPIFCNQECLTAESKNTSKGGCTDLGCRSGQAKNKKKCNSHCPNTASGGHDRIITQPNAVKPAAGYPTKGIFNNKVFSHTEDGVCGNKCDGAGIVYLSKKSINGNLGAWECKLTTCPHGKYPTVSDVVTENNSYQKCTVKCEYGKANYSNCNDQCDYPHSQNTANGACKPITQMAECGYGLTDNLRNKRQVWGYKASRAVSTAANTFNKNKKMHGCFSSKPPNMAEGILYKATYATGGVLQPYTCVNGISTKHQTKCNKTCHAPWKAGTTGTENNYKHFSTDTQNICVTACTEEGNHGVIGDPARCKVTCDDKNISSDHGTLKKTFNGHNIYYKDNKYVGPCKLVTGLHLENNETINICQSKTGVCKMKTNTDCKKFGVNRAGTNCNSNGKGYCGTKGTTKTMFGGTTYQRYVNTEHGICIPCVSGANYNITGCNTTNRISYSIEVRCIEFSDAGGCVVQQGDTHKGNGHTYGYYGSGWATITHGRARLNLGNYTVPGPRYNWGWNGNNSGTCYSISPKFGNGAAGGITINGSCANCKWYGATKLRSARDPNFGTAFNNWRCNGGDIRNRLCPNKNNSRAC